jgi:hypothetical protein
VKGAQSRAEGDGLSIRPLVVVQPARQHLDETHPATELSGQPDGGLGNDGSRAVVDDSSHHLGQ